MARAFRTHFGLDELYLADLDAITGADPAQAVYAALRTDGFRLWIDAGVREVDRADLLAEAGVETIVVGLETVAGPEALAEARQRFGELVVFSLDLKGGTPLGDAAVWGTTAPEAIAERAVALGVRKVIVLDLAHVGVGDGTGTEALCTG